jgi:hypothetical protein
VTHENEGWRKPVAAIVWLARPTHVAYMTRAEKLREIRAEELTEQP